MRGRWIARASCFSLCLAVLLAFGGSAEAKWRAPIEMPIDRLLKSTSEYVKSHPNDAQGYYMLARINSAAFSKTVTTFAVYNDSPLPQLPPFSRSPVLQPGRSQPPSESAVRYYEAALRNYKKTTSLDSKLAVAWLGYGFQCEEGLPWPITRTKARSVLSLKGGAEADVVRSEALKAYRKAYELAHEDDLKATSAFGKSISQEAAESIVRVQTDRKLNSTEKAEVAQLNEVVKKLEALPRRITPIVIAFGGQTRLTDLISADAKVPFDLSGEGTSRAWPWVKPDTGILVWNPKNTGKITSGLQLFGSVTWWLFWKDGYAPLAALDDNYDGWLEGRELKGIAVWFDRNSNGVSDKGEVVSLESLAVRRISVRASLGEDGALGNAAGVEFRDGRTAATFDWTPKSFPAAKNGTAPSIMKP